MNSVGLRVLSGSDGQSDFGGRAANQRERFWKTGLVARDSDSFDIFPACSEYWGREFKEAVLARDGLVERPDSGDPPTIVVDVLRRLGEAFGTTTNSLGFKLLHSKVRVLHGGGIDFTTLGQILSAMKVAGWPADNIAFGSGGGLLQKQNRETQRFAFKCSSVVVGDQERNVFRCPIIDGAKSPRSDD